LRELKQKNARAEEVTFASDPMRLDYGDRKETQDTGT
jgi:hypothetical protein